MKYFILFLFPFLFFISNAQSKKETQDWILSKINKYKETEYFGGAAPHLGFSVKIKSITFVECKLIIVQISEGIREKNDSGTEKFTATTTLTIPLTKISEISYDTGNKLKFETSNAEISWETNDPQHPSNNEITYQKFVLIRVNLDTEDNLPKRMIKAFEHFKSNYCKKTESKETF